MTRTARLLTLAASLTLLVATISTATAGPPDGSFCDKHENHARCQSEPEPPSGLTCVDYEKIAPEAYEEALVWDVSLSESMLVSLMSGESDICVDISNSVSGSFEVDVENVDGAKRSNVLYALIKDSHPGDHCGTAPGEPGSALNLDLRNSEPAGEITDVPAATLNACGTEYSEAWVEEIGDGEWVITQKIGEDEETPDPLALILGISGKPGVTAEVTITYCAPGVPPCPPAVVTGIAE
jgi:hypothetical protein